MSWTQPVSLSRAIEFVGHMTRVLKELGGPLCSRLAELVEKEDYRSVVEWSFDYNDESLHLDDLIYARQIQALLSKQDFMDLGYDREARAWEKFQESEAKCRETNERFRALESGATFAPDVECVLFYARRKISDVLGSLESCGELDFAFGPGANTSTKAAVANARHKLSASLECSTNLAPSVGLFLSEFPMWTAAHAINGVVPVKVSPGKLQFVPKDARTHRSIVVEPILNGLFQKGFGSYMKRRLRRFGIDLTDQTRNQQLAKRGSVDGTLCTIDLSSASDCISRELVWSLLPLPWAKVLDAGRTPNVTYRGEQLLLEKFSSMGNAYTFELESLIFWALTMGACKFLDLETESVSVYGDDIICPVSAHALLLRVLDVCGFTVNSGKSYVYGPFRESCGADWFRGNDIRPFFLRKQVSDQSLFAFHNFLVRRGEWRLARVVKSHIKPHNRIYGPDGYGDGHLLGSYQLRSSRKLRRCGYEGGFFDTFVKLPRRVKLPYRNDWLFPSYSVYVRSGQESETDPHIVRGSRGYRRLSIYTLARGVFTP